MSPTVSGQFKLFCTFRDKGEEVSGKDSFFLTFFACGLELTSGRGLPISLSLLVDQEEAVVFNFHIVKYRIAIY